jgi:hypothetical protein
MTTFIIDHIYIAFVHYQGTLEHPLEASYNADTSVLSISRHGWTEVIGIRLDREVIGVSVSTLTQAPPCHSILLPCVVYKWEGEVPPGLNADISPEADGMDKEVEMPRICTRYVANSDLDNILT